MLILAIDTSADSLGLCVSRDGTSVAKISVDSRDGSSRLLPELAEFLMNTAGISAAELDAVAAAHGPGSFTGIRITCAFAAGFARGLGIPAVGIDSLAALAASVSVPPGNVAVPALSARRGAFFTAAYRRALRDDGFYWEPSPYVTPGRRTPAEMMRMLGDDTGGAWWISDKSLEGDCEDQPWAECILGASISPAAVAYLGYCALRRVVMGDPRLLTPHYHRASEVERKNPGGTQDGRLR
ncbi:MAG: tRNA (adenosine(37)-N6)-threonylcarbamoyltransferase complex dimerization subunit type 1 TsaB [Bacillota bacterium]